MVHISQSTRSCVFGVWTNLGDFSKFNMREPNAQYWPIVFSVVAAVLEMSNGHPCHNQQSLRLWHRVSTGHRWPFSWYRRIPHLVGYCHRHSLGQAATPVAQGDSKAMTVTTYPYPQELLTFVSYDVKIKMISGFLHNLFSSSWGQQKNPNEEVSNLVEIYTYELQHMQIEATFC